MRQLYVVTGTSRGLGAAIAARLLGRADTTLIGIARGEQAQPPAGDGTVVFEPWRADLAEPAPVAARLEAWLAAEAPDRYAGAHLIHNAALLTTIGPLDRSSAAELAAALRVGLEAPLLLTAAFLRATAAWAACDRRVLAISSGLGRRAMAGQATYCAVKAGLDHLARAVALDEAGRPHGARIVSLAPGVIDTDMQAQLRGAGDDGFPDRGRFIDFQRNGMLQGADDTAARVLRFLDRPDFGAEPVADIRDA